ncbi:unnamed protein product [Sphenostylis stenocarpa]|uniref:Uncharacterized protein n=1 Tax=Sphenostylis stenocarpa TaxID=92480 RepID=A0AA86VQT2_9FABA|nr:unnamed protein product [Sphenostylis stenocarpa]
MVDLTKESSRIVKSLNILKHNPDDWISNEPEDKYCTTWNGSSDIAWKDAKYAQIWEYLRDEFNLNQKFARLDLKLKLVEDIGDE